VLALLLAASGWYMLGGRLTKPAEAARLSIVVLPFANLSGDPAQDYLVDALVDELTTRIARFPGSFVIARNTAFTFKGKTIDAKVIGKDLGVRYVLEGSVQLNGAQMRVNAQLIDAESGAHVWAEEFASPRTDLLQMQNEVVTHLARALELQLSGAEAARLNRTPPANPSAEDLALRCEGDLGKVGYLGEAAEGSSRLCEQALAIDPNNVRALTALSLKYSQQVAMGSSANTEADLKRADELASHALTLEPNWYRPHLFKAFVLTLQNRFEEAMMEEERTLSLDPNATDAYGGLGWDYAGLGQFERSLEYFDKASRISPLDPSLIFWYNGKAGDYFGLKQYDQGIEWARRSIAINPNRDNAFPHSILIAALALTGRASEAREALQRYLDTYSTGQLRTIVAWKANMSMGSSTDPRVLDANDRTIEGLRRAGMPEQ
jgi:TolB-like protein/Tfp pilus assembly protein PilF